MEWEWKGEDEDGGRENWLEKKVRKNPVLKKHDKIVFFI